MAFCNFKYLAFCTVTIVSSKLHKESQQLKYDHGWMDGRTDGRRYR